MAAEVDIQSQLSDSTEIQGVDQLVLVDQLIRQALASIAMMLPEGKRTVTDVEREIRRLLDRALANLKEDAAAFGVTKPTVPAGPTGHP